MPDAEFRFNRNKFSETGVRATRFRARLVLENLGDDIRDWIKENVRRDYTGAMRQGITRLPAEVTGDSVKVRVVGRAPHTAAQMQGRRPGQKGAPYLSILEKMKKEGRNELTFPLRDRVVVIRGKRHFFKGRPSRNPEVNQRRIAFLVARHIGRYGFRGQNLFLRSLIVNRGLIRAAARQIGDEIVAYYNSGAGES